ncbi:ABC transporter permease [Puniceibacterium sediminis]|uniref:Phospholipid/cholesterol/gamma-HCH transport system permease protein n=1 Tax=Puniceibacterium sediminis TaxID=1608407 RepID=A0A238WST6_9RHOB|nr:MlaE family lipid ABC transporter permease subunit [Puniceibacterium sediminis]SNR49626.1 phospholipid/cholesterol/gamma-HCH transport system permease protein [Puniceibacterium sediminis]
MSPNPDMNVEIDETQATVRLVLRGALTIANVTELEGHLGKIGATAPVAADLSGVQRIDTAGAWAVATLRERIQAGGQQFDILGATEQVEDLLHSVANALPHPEALPVRRATLPDWIIRVGKAVSRSVQFLAALTSYLGLFLARLGRAARHPTEFRLTALVHHCEEVGLRAVPIVALMSFLIGVVLAFQGSTQLRQFGAEVFVVDLLAISILRELGILLTSIIVAGRTASAFTAAIGSMKMREEIDAMRTLGLDPAMTLFVPRILALILMLPILGLVADVMGLVGGGLMAWIDLGISPAMFVTRLIEGTDVNHVTVGMIKAPFFAVIIGVVGCHAGMQVQSNAESLGRMTSNAVVTAIFAVIVADAVFSIFFAQIGI